MSHPILVDRPVILCKHKRNAISNGRLATRQVTGQDGKNIFFKLPSSVPSMSLGQYHKVAQENLITINNNLSNMLQETFSGIDNICHKVRMCLMEANTIRPRSADKPEHLITTQSSTCQKSTIEVDNGRHSEDAIAEIVEETGEENEEEEEVTYNLNTEKAKESPSITPFFTILNPKTQSAESVAVTLINSITSKLGLLRKCTTENLQKNMKKIEKLNNYDNFLTSMVNNVKKEIDDCYVYFKKTNKSRRPQTSPVEPLNQYSTNRVHIQELKKFQRAFNEDHILDNDLICPDVKGKISTKKPLGIAPDKMDFTQADVYRKRAITDLHRRMMAQLEANDSFVFFQKLMKKTRKRMGKFRSQTADNATSDNDIRKSPINYLSQHRHQGAKRQRSQFDLANRYENSLWFSQRKHKAKRAKKEKGPKKPDNKFNKNDKYLPQSYTVYSSVTLRGKPSMRKPAEEGCKNNCSQPSKCKISVTNNQPLSDSEKCKINWMRVKSYQLSQKKLKHLDILDDITKNDLLPLKAEYPRRDEVIKAKGVKDSYLYKLMYGKDKGNKDAWSELFEPNVKCSKENCKKCINMNLLGDNPENLQRISGQTDINRNRSQVVRTLSKYIFPEISQPNTFTVMPVHVFYDNPRLGGNNRKLDVLPQKLSLLPMKETKESVRKAEWTSDNVRKAKPMKIVYDPILRKIEKEIRMVGKLDRTSNVNTKQMAATSWSPRGFTQFCTTRQPVKNVKIDTLQKQQKTFGPRHTSPTPEICIKRAGSPKASSEHGRVPVPPLWNASDVKSFSHRKEAELNHRIQKDIDAQSARLKSDHDRKIWENKYGKSVGQKLLNFIEKQPIPYRIPVPKYALPRPAKNTSRQEQMLQQLRSLKHKNDTIQNNIQRAIEVIENKMVALLCKPTTTESLEAFDEMEKEITNVLSMLKTSTPNAKKKTSAPKTDESGSDVDKISEELFRRLDKILESPGRTASSRGSSSNSGDKPKKKSKQKSSEMNEVSFSSTSASGEEKFIITAISPKRASKNAPVESNSVEFKLVESQDKPIQPQEKKLEITRESDITRPENVPGVVKEIMPIQEQVVNIALFNIAQDQSSGDPNSFISYEQKCLSETDLDELTYSIGDGDSALQSDYYSNCTKDTLRDNVDETFGTFEEVDGAVCKTPPKIDSLELDHQPPKIVESMGGDCPDTVSAKERPSLSVDKSEPYFTPKMSPTSGARRPDEFSDIIENTSIGQGQEQKDVNIEEQNEEIETVEPQKTTKKEEISEDSSGTSTNRDHFYQNINKIISRVESVYNQLEEFEMRTEDSINLLPKIAIFQDPPKTPLESDEFLTPFMHAVKDLRKSGSEGAEESRKSSARLYRSPSYFNVLSFLDSLADFKEDRPIEVHTSRTVSVAHIVHTPITFHQSNIYNELTLTNQPNESNEMPKKKSSCLKNPSSHANMETSQSKSKQKVSFLLEKEEKGVQVAACRFHTAVKILAEHSVLGDTPSSASSKKDEQVSAYLDALENKSVDKMSFEDENTGESSFELSDTLLSERNQMPEQLVQNALEKDEENENRKNVVEIFRNGSSEEKDSEKIKVFYDTYYRTEQEKLNKHFISGCYNENSLSKVEQSLNKNLALKKRDSLEKLLKNIDSETLLREPSLLEPLKNLSDFIDSKLLKEAIEYRHKIRMIRRKSMISLMMDSKDENKIEEKGRQANENFLKSVYVFVYLLMFTALNLDYRCVQ